MHTDIPTRADLEQLLSVRDAACVSIYLPTAPEERGERDRLEFKSLAAEALEQLTAAAIGYARRVEEALRPTLTVLDLPLILAASEPLDSIFRSVSTYAHLARPVIPGDGPAAAILRYPV